MSLRRKCKIENTKVDGHYDTRRIYNFSDYLSTKSEMRGKKRILLPTWSWLEKVGKRDYLWILLEDLTVTINFENDSFMQLKFKAGFIWDQASVPFFKNNDKQEIIAAMVHDAMFSMHYLFPEDNNKGFRAANKLFKAMTYEAIDEIVKDEGHSRFKRAMLRIKARWHYRSVMSIFGRSRYEKDSPRRAFWHSKTVQFTCSRNSEWGRKN